ncbi:Ig-like domain-containing protein [Pediococcus argentinicus]|uniref:Uncharacterized protein n=1 Tax=Pediococcus argentinicus TaxID=480391 RepID=A0A0R2NL47_9LACO|nr:hypothetical protein [Pediococcus argentinicus]KRO25088.1 hypothetical protein IV88_GL000421 [Pediococcus argentinicus]NKZ22569.1 hypothetical protein [Pediococcus argentinicus]GEP19593.1 hypothetical protein LSA03_09770 [Pediococcus argentinicus]
MAIKKTLILAGLGLFLVGLSPEVHAQKVTTPKATVQKLYKDDTYVSGKAANTKTIKVILGKRDIGHTTLGKNKKFHIKLKNKLTNVKKLQVLLTNKHGQQKVKTIEVKPLKTNKIKNCTVMASPDYALRPTKTGYVEVNVDATSDWTKGSVVGLKYMDGNNEYGDRTYKKANFRLVKGKVVRVHVTAKHYKAKTIKVKVSEYINNRDFYHDGATKMIALRDLRILKNGPVIKRNTEFTYVHHYKGFNESTPQTHEMMNKKGLNAIKDEQIYVNYQGNQYQLQPVNKKFKAKQSLYRRYHQNNLQIERLIQNLKSIVIVDSWMNNFSYEGLVNENKLTINSTMSPDNTVIGAKGATWNKYSYKKGKLKKVATFKGRDDGNWAKDDPWEEY